MFYLYANKFKAGQKIVLHSRVDPMWDFLPVGHRLLTPVYNSPTMVIKMVDRLNGIYYVRDEKRGDHGLDKLISFSVIHELYKLAPSGWRIGYVGK